MNRCDLEPVLQSVYELIKDNYVCPNLYTNGIARPHFHTVHAYAKL